MAPDPDFDRIYRLLEVGPGDGWEGVRAAFRRKAQAWHPDKAAGNPKVERIAKMRFEELTDAYAQLRKYHRIFGVLPPRKIKKNKNLNTERLNFSETDQNPYQPPQPKPQRFLRRRLTALLTLIIVATALAFVLEDYVDQPTEQAVSSSPISTADRRVYGTQRQTEKVNIGNGSTVGQLIEVYGKPDSVDNNIWTYGKASYEIENGRVVDMQGDGAYQAVSSYMPDRGLPGSDDRAVKEQSKAFFRLGSTKPQVLAVQGKPITVSATQWDYGVSKVYFEGDLVSGWYNSPLDPLKIDPESEQ